MSETGGSLDGTLLNEIYTRYDPDTVQASFAPPEDAQGEQLFTPGPAHTPAKDNSPVQPYTLKTGLAPAHTYTPGSVQTPAQVNAQTPTAGLLNTPGSSVTPGPALGSEKLYSSADDRANSALYTPPPGTPEQLYSEYEQDDYSGLDNVYTVTYRAPVNDETGLTVFDKYPQGYSEAWLKKNMDFFRLVQNRPGLSADDRVKETLETRPVAMASQDEMPASRRVDLWGDYLAPELTIPESMSREERDEFVRSQYIGLASTREAASWSADPMTYYAALNRRATERTAIIEAWEKLQEATTASPAPAVARTPSLATSPMTSRTAAPSAPRVVSPEATGAESAAQTATLGAGATAEAAPSTTASQAPSVSATRAAAPALTASPSVVSQRSDAAAAETTTSQAPSTPAAQAATPALTASPRAVSQRSDTEAAETTAIPAPSAPAARAAAPALTASPRVVSQRSDAKAADEPVITEPAAKLPRRTRAPDSSADLVQKLNDIELWLGEIASLLKKKSSSSGDGTYSGMHALADELVRLIRYSADRESSRRGWY